MVDDKEIIAILVRENYVTEDDVKKVEELAASRHIPLLECLLGEGLITKSLLGQAFAESYGVPYADLAANAPDADHIFRIPSDVAKKYHAVFLKEDGGGVTVAAENPKTEGLEAEMQKLFAPKKVSFAYALPEDIEASFVYYRKPLETRFGKIIEAQGMVAPGIIEEIFEDALAYRASDIHFEPHENDVLIRFRVDGVLHEAGHFPKEHYENILNRVKVQARLRIDEHFSAQDGAMRFEPKQGPPIDFRVSIAPTLDGEKIAIRILAEYIRSFSLTDLGFHERDRDAFVTASKKPFGMILATGPTGSGKTTTLYALLKILNRPEVNITTIEDPVEYKMAGVNQIQVNLQTNLTFADGLRSIVRQDPNVILVGEVRDRETAEISVNAALTGHLLLTTLHANDAATAIPRLLDMGVEPFLLSSTLELIVAQRLVRKICFSCRFSYTEERGALQKLFPRASQFFPDEQLTLYRGKGCNVCNHTGYKERTAIFEFIRSTPELQELIVKNPSTPEIWKLARSQGSRALFEDGIEKVRSGITTLEELLRVATPPQG